MNLFNVGRPVISTIAWSIIAEIARHAGSGLQVIEMHPGGGQYDLLSLFDVSNPNGSAYDKSSVLLGDFNLRSGTLRGHANENGTFDWLSSWFENSDRKITLLGAMEALRLKPVRELAPTDRTVFGYRFIAAILAAKLLDRDAVDARMGFEDTSGDGGGTSQHLRQFSALFRQVGGDDTDTNMKQAARCWLLLSGANYDLKGAIRTDGQLSSMAQPDTAYDLFASYRRTHSMRKTVAEAMEILSL